MLKIFKRNLKLEEYCKTCKTYSSLLIKTMKKDKNIDDAYGLEDQTFFNTRYKMQKQRNKTTHSCSKIYKNRQK